ncbi:MAG: M48 family metallopeptidase [Candidatus Gastranaerophilales bacterium]|nr:M48 family metallopeptidase [Candidatus Gastranaerophilales bacterium]
MWHQIAINKRNSCILLTLMLLVLLVLGAAFGMLISYYFPIEMARSADFQQMMLHSAQDGIIVAFVVWCILLLCALTNGKNAILALNQAYKLPEYSHLVLENVVEEMSIAAGLPKPPEIYVIDTAMPNAFATGLNPKKAAIAVTTGLLVELDRDELQAVVAHEIAHIVNRDTMYMIFAGVMIGTIVFLSELGLRFMRNGFRSKRCRGGGKGDLIILVVCLFLMILAPILAQLLYFSISQRREYLADACAVQYTRYPQGLATALAKISGSLYMFRDADKITSAMYIVHPLDYEKRYKSTYSMFGNAFSTHPPTEKRIKILEKMTGADFNAYNEAFVKVSKFGKRPLLKKEFLYGVKPMEIQNPKEKKEKENPVPSAMGIAAAAAGVAVLSEAEKAHKLAKEKVERKRSAQNIVLKANNYIEKECSCGTKFKFPEEYEGQTIRCPHCKQNILV